MSKIIEFRMFSDENDSFVREYQIEATATLEELHHLICTNMHFDKGEIYTIYAADQMWEPLQEYASEDMGMGLPSMKDTLIGDVVKEPGHNLIYLFDMLGERALYLQAAEIMESEAGINYPRVTLAEGDAPDQFEASMGDSGSSMFDEAMGDYNDFEGDDYYGDDE